MTTIAAKKHADHIELAADSFMSQGAMKELTSDKLCLDYIGHDFIFALSGSCAAANQFKIFLDDIAEWPTGLVSALDVNKLILLFMEFIRKFDTVKHDDFNMIIIWNGQLFYATHGFVQKIDTMIAIGYGAEFSMGVMAAGESATEAVKLACEHCDHTQAPVRTIKLYLNDGLYSRSMSSLVTKWARQDLGSQAVEVN